MKKILLALLLLCFIKGNSQIIDFTRLNRDSLHLVINKKGVADSTRLYALYSLASSYDYYLPDSMLHYALILRTEARKCNNILGEAKSWSLEGYYNGMLGKLKETLQCHLKALELAETLNSDFEQGIALSDVGTSYMNLFMTEKALFYQNKALVLARKMKDPSYEAHAMVNMAITYGNSGNAEKSIEINRRVLFLIDSLKIENGALKSGAMANLAQELQVVGNKEESLHYLLMAVQENTKNKNLYFLGINLQNLGNLYSTDSSNTLGKITGDTRKSYDIAVSYYKMLDSIATEGNDTGTLVGLYLNYSNVLFLKGEVKKALNLAETGWKWSKQYGPKLLESDYAQQLAIIHYKLGDYKISADFYRLRMRMKDSLDQVSVAQKVSLLSESFEIEQRDEQLKLKGEQLRNNQFLMYASIGFAVLILGLALILLYYFRQKQRFAKALSIRNVEVEKARARAEQNEQFKERFLASMSHEIRTPLNAVIGMTDLLLDDQHEPRTKHYLESIRNAGEHLTGIINDILDLSKLEAGKLELHPGPLKLSILLEELRDLFEIRAKEKDIVLLTGLDPQTPAWVTADAGRIRQVLVNLTGNAIKFTQKGSVSIRITSGAISEGRYPIIFMVEDTGPGISPSDLSMIFEEYVQSDQHGAKQQPGTGLGLSISRTLVEHMGGTLTVESEPNRGSLFSFVLLLAASSEEENAAMQRESALSAQAMKGAYHILVVEDNPSNRIVTEGMLEKILPESDVVMAEDGEKAIGLLQEDSFDFILMDIQLPGIDGYEVTRRLRKLQNSNASVPVIALTASVIRSDIQKCLDAGMNAYVPKPVNRNMLARTIREQMNLTEYLDDTQKAPGSDDFLPAQALQYAWAASLSEICNGKMERFQNYLNIFITETDKELALWQDYLDKKEKALLARSLHKLLPYFKLFDIGNAYLLALSLEQELAGGWPEHTIAQIEEIMQGLLSRKAEVKQILDQA